MGTYDQVMCDGQIQYVPHPYGERLRARRVQFISRLSFLFSSLTLFSDVECVTHVFASRDEANVETAVVHGVDVHILVWAKRLSSEVIMYHNSQYQTSGCKRSCRSS